MTDSTSPTQPAPHAGRRRILIVDDADELRELYRLALQGEGYHVRTAPLAEKALEVLRAWRPDLVLTDLFMPGMGGLELITRLRSDFTPPVPPIVVVSGFPDVMAEALKRGALRFETKPVTPDELVRLVEDVFATAGPPRLRRPDLVRERRDATRAIGEATLARHLTEDPDVFRRVGIQARAVARFFDDASMLIFFLEGAALKLVASSNPEYRLGADASEILPVANDVVETGGSLVITNGASQLLAPPGRSAALRFLVAVPWMLDHVAIGAYCLVDDVPHDFDSAALAILQYLTRRGAAVMKGGRRTLDESGILERAAFGAVLHGSVQSAQEHGHALGFTTFEVAQIPRDGSLAPLLESLPAPRLMVGVVDRRHVAVFAIAESVELVRERLTLVRREVERRLAVERTVELVYDDPIPGVEPDVYAARAREVLARAEIEGKAFLAVDAVRRGDPTSSSSACPPAPSHRR